MRDYEAIIAERRGPLAVLTLNRPDKLNALSGHLRAEVAEALAALRADDHIRALVVTGAGRGFCSGVDLTGDTPLATGRGFEGLPQEARLDELGWVGRWALMWRSFDKPIVGARRWPATSAWALNTRGSRASSSNARFRRTPG
jgi:enoyl-CoA hydratase/carnithine racemase